MKSEYTNESIIGSDFVPVNKIRALQAAKEELLKRGSHIMSDIECLQEELNYLQERCAQIDEQLNYIKKALYSQLR